MCNPPRFYVLLVLETVIAFNIQDADKVDVVDLTRPTTWYHLSEYYGALEKRWKICINCGTPSLGTGMYLERAGSTASMHPAVIPSEYLMTRLSIIDVSALAMIDPSMVLTLDIALQWPSLKRNPQEPTLLLFKFGWKEDDTRKRIRNCVCNIPGLSYELAAWIATNLSHVIGVATDTPTLESDQTREFSSRTVSNLLARSGVYMIENVNMKRKIPEKGCMALAMPLKLLNTNYVPTRLTAFCPSLNTDQQVVLDLKDFGLIQQGANSRVYDVNLEEILNR